MPRIGGTLSGRAACNNGTDKPSIYAGSAKPAVALAADRMGIRHHTNRFRAAGDLAATATMPS
jgi:hypothetical protein